MKVLMIIMITIISCNSADSQVPNWKEFNSKNKSTVFNEVFGLSNFNIKTFVLNSSLLKLEMKYTGTSEKTISLMNTKIKIVKNDLIEIKDGVLFVNGRKKEVIYKK